MAKKPQELDEATPATPVLTIGTYTFEVDTVDELPTPERASVLALPFRKLFETLKNNQGTFIPRSVFEANRAEGSKPLSVSDMRTKLRTHFLNWRKESPEDRANVDAVMYNRKAGDVIRDGHPPVAEDGIHLYMKKP